MHEPVIEQIKRPVDFKGETVTVSPLTVRQIPAFARAIKPSFPELASVFGGLMDGAEIDPQVIVDLLADHGDALIDATAVATGKPAEWIGESDAAEFIGLVRAVIEVNADFFAQRLGPTMAAAAASGAGRTPSKP